MKRNLKIFLLAVLAGICIGIGGTVYLSLDNKIVGSLMFACGLYAICTQGLYLYTGKIGYLFDNDLSYVKVLLLTWFGNLFGTAIAAIIVLSSRIGLNINEVATKVCAAKLNDTFLSLLMLGIMCGLLMYIAVDGYKKTTNPLILFIPVSVFILCGFEHCIADMYYFWVAGLMNLTSLGKLLIITLGNSIGGVLIPVVQKMKENGDK